MKGGGGCRGGREIRGGRERERGGERRRNGQLGNFFFSLRGTFNKDKNLMEEKRTVIARIIVAF